MTYTFRPQGGVCSQKMTVELDDDGKILNFTAVGGCSGNLQGIGALIRGMPAEEVIQRLRGIHCGPRPTSCPDQLAKGLEAILAQK